MKEGTIGVAFGRMPEERLRVLDVAAVEDNTESNKALCCA
jgi:hypothetical protein